tara:strand:+ start:4451 stop:4744 length:294 start_codon:yes stop_codon:yes gene_type:complete
MCKTVKQADADRYVQTDYILREVLKRVPSDTLKKAASMTGCWDYDLTNNPDFEGIRVVLVALAELLYGDGFFVDDVLEVDASYIQSEHKRRQRGGGK